MSNFGVLWKAILFVVCLALGAGLLSVQTAQATAGATAPQSIPVDPQPDNADPVKPDLEPSQGVKPDDRSSKLGQNWSKSKDLAWTTIGDQDGFKVLVSRASEGYVWTQVAALGNPAVETDRWIGNACSISAGKKLAVVYAPRTFTNSERLSSAGAFAAVVDLITGKVEDLGRGFSIAYFNPGCGNSDLFTLTTYAKDEAKTRVALMKSGSLRAVKTYELNGQVTSPVPTEQGIFAAYSDGIRKVDANIAGDISSTPIIRTNGSAYHLTSLNGELGYVEQDHGKAAVKTIALKMPSVNPVIIASGEILGTALVRDGRGRPYVSGDALTLTGKKSALGQTITAVSANAEVSSLGELAVEPTSTKGQGQNSTSRVEIKAKSTITGADIDISAEISSEGIATNSSARGAPTTVGQSGRTGPVAPGNLAETDRVCAVPRNDPKSQALQPKPRQVEWAVDQLVQNSLNVVRPANWNNLGMPGYNVNQLFPMRQLAGGKEIPPQVMLGVIAQESNMWQSSRFALPGATGNPLIGNYYGSDFGSAEDNTWGWNFPEADCGYGLTQLTDGMRLAGREGGSTPAMPYDSQRAVALDFVANIAAGMQKLQEKWNQTNAAGLIVNDGNSEKIENWFIAVWAYNSGFYAKGAGPWGVGWFNNPANPRYPASRAPFLESGAADAAHPQDWPYPEKVMGFAAYPPFMYENDKTDQVAAYRIASWNGDETNAPLNRRAVKPPVD